MASSSTTNRSLCKKCNKARSIFFCQGCQQDFCKDHATEHRQELSNQLEAVIVEHDQLKEILAECTKKPGNHSLMQEIDQWERQSIEKIHQAAADARKQLLSVVGRQTTDVADELKNLTQQLTEARSEDNFIEIDLKEWTEQLTKWTKSLSTPSAISIQQERSDRPFIQKILVSSGNNHFFERVAGDVEIRDNGYVIRARSTGQSTVRCHGDYARRQHRFRFRIEQKSASNWMYFGIVSKNTPIQADSYRTPTNFGWITSGYVLLNASVRAKGHEVDLLQNDAFELFLDCDRQLIRLTNERTKVAHEIDVNITQCPFPWQVHVCLLYQNDTIRYLPV